jgi:hypothetical protein
MSHTHTILGQIMQLIPRFEFDQLVQETKTEYCSHGFSSWNHFGALLFGQLSGQDSLRPLVAGLATNASRLYHLGMTPVSRSTLAYANEHRSHELFVRLFGLMLSKCQAIAPNHKYHFKHKVFSIDASLIPVCLNLFDWAKYRKSKGAAKLHVKLDHSGYIPQFAIITPGKDHEVRIARQFSFDPGDVVVFDRGYTDFGFFRTLVDKGVFFVTRMKSNADYTVVERRPCSNPLVSSDQLIRMDGFYSAQKYPGLLRRIRIQDPETGEYICLLTNHLGWSTDTISKIYRDRWQIEIFFRTIKQNLKIKGFLGTSENALLSQLWVALIAYLLLSFLKFKSTFQWSIQTLCAILPMNLFAQRNLWNWLDDPYHKLSKKPLTQLTFSFG